MLKRKLLVLGISLVVGALSSTLFHRRKKTPVHTAFIGEWFYFHKHRQVTVAVNEDLTLYIQNRLHPATVLEATPQRLVFLDTLGYQIIFEKNDTILSFHDETEDATFLLTKK
ncbi:DUF4828 domain-containing protein [Enterococcus saccharolyticus]|uniref:DUF4828 domain-containing protein n=1 Tax=Enterococcus saccharolyticus TaxID=41997 RepID=UPI001E449BB8|nr:DUF4828 domain-containing protein [Enterococcus saccharolyticus]MCD5002669.1 DUF4828 domain-containing protein [Enterococcus saccharolyticus]